MSKMIQKIIKAAWMTLLYSSHIWFVGYWWRTDAMDSFAGIAVALTAGFICVVSFFLWVIALIDMAMVVVNDEKNQV